MLGANGHILVGGYYKSINGSSADPYMTSLDPTTGKDDGFLHLSISGNYSFAGTHNADPRLQPAAQPLRASTTWSRVTSPSVGGLPRQQIFMLDLSTNPATVTGWTSPEWDGSLGELSASATRAAIRTSA